MPSSKGRGASSDKKSSAGKARVISVRSTDALPRKGSASAGRRKPVVVEAPPVDAPAVTAVATTKKKSHQPQHTIATRAKATRVAGRTPAKRKKTAAPKAEAVAAVETEEVLVVEASAIVEEMTIVEPPVALPAEALTVPGGEIEQVPASEQTRRPPPIPAAAAIAAPAAPAPDQAKRALVTAASRLLSTLLRWTGVRH